LWRGANWNYQKFVRLILNRSSKGEVLKRKREGIESCCVLFAPSGWSLIFAVNLNFGFSGAKNLNRTWVDLGLLQ
jgi:hypothetical protein